MAHEPRAQGRAWIGFLAPVVLYGLLAWRIATVQTGRWSALGIACAVLAFFGHANVWRWARRTSRDQPPPLAWIAVYFASVIGIVVALGRGGR